MNEFVDECRREWTRLGVPDPIADEMAADLEADLEEAASEGASPAEVLGSGAFDPRAFAASWATERGVVGPRSSERTGRLGPPTLAALVTIAALALVGASLAILAADSDPETAHVRVLAPERLGFLPDDGQVRSLEMPPVTVTPDGMLVVGQSPEPGFTIHPQVGWTLLIVGLAGIVPALLLWSSWARSRRPAATA